MLVIKELERELRRSRAEAKVRQAEALVNEEIASPYGGVPTYDVHCKVSSENGVFATNILFLS